MQELLKTFDNIEKAFQRNKAVTIAAVICSFLFSTVVAVGALLYVNSNSSQVYVVDGGKVVAAARTDEGMSIEYEVRDQVTRLHELVFNLAPNASSIRENQDRALLISDRSVYSYFKDLEEKNYYNRLIQGNITQQVMVDSVKVDLTVYPFEVRTYARQYAMRESNISLYELQTSCKVVRTQRSKENPHGLIIEAFNLTESRHIETRRRNGGGRLEQ